MRSNREESNRDVIQPHQSMMDIFKEPTFAERIRLIMYGLKQPKDSGAYKYAKLQLKRLQSPIAGVVVPALAVLLVGIFTAFSHVVSRDVPVQFIEPQKPPELEKPEPLPEEKVEPPDPVEVDIPQTRVDVENPDPSPPVDFSPQPAAFDSVAIVKSPIIMRNIYGSRTPGMRGIALRIYGGSGATEDAVLRALRWLKKNQNEDGSWSGQKNERVAFTGFALLAYLAHGETPASKEFGKTVEKAINYLLNSQQGEIFGPNIPYRHQIATYALAEAYTMTKIPKLKEAAEKGLSRIISGQNPAGGWNYELRPCERNDMSVGAWCAQALKAGKIAGLTNPELDKCIKHALNGARNNYGPNGGFGYTGPGATGLSGAGTLWMQLLGEPNSKEVKTTIENVLSKRTIAGDKSGAVQGCRTHAGVSYSVYYDTQAMFHYGGEVWKNWNKQMAPALVNSQQIIAQAIEGPDGKLKDIGYWPGDYDTVMTTCLYTLTLEVYYRYLPTYTNLEDFIPESEKQRGITVETDVPVIVREREDMINTNKKNSGDSANIERKDV